MIQTGTPFLWEQLLQVPFAQRLAPAPDEIVNFIAAYNAAHGSPLQASAAVPDEHFVADLAAAIETLPTAVKAHLEPRLLGIFFMRGLVSSAVTDLLAYANGDILGAFVVVDVDAFAQTRANAWLSWRERTAFEARDGYRVDVAIAAGEDDTRQSALQYILLHEFGHVLASASRFMPDWWLPRIEALPAEAESFAALSWALQPDGRMRPHPHDEFPLRDRIVLYATPRLEGTQMPAIYADLARTAFPTLYAASDVHEDFAECFATYVHCVLLGKPYALSVFEGEQLQARHEGFWQTERAVPKARFLAALLARAPEHFPRYPIHREAHLLCADILQRAASEFLGLAPLLRLNLDTGDLRHVARTLLAQTGADQDNAILWMNLATAFFAVGERELGLAMQAQALLLQRQYTLTAAVQPVQMRVLMLMAPGDLAENTPLDCLLEGSPVDFVLYYVSEAAPLPQPLPPHDVLLVGLSQTDSNHAVLQALAGLLV
ncbi:MAG TPA: hypothetical protein VN028_01895, partial [Rhodocyclaceae bacterium]|nr:hypothetical protein [Rhodocyclaceae bacterium]